MFLGRQYGAKGIYKVFCMNCNDFYYVSATGKDIEHDYMYQAADALTGQKSVTVDGDLQLADGSHKYEIDNDFEAYGILKRVESPSDCRHTFIKGEHYHEFMKKLFPPSLRATKVYTQNE